MALPGSGRGVSSNVTHFPKPVQFAAKFQAAQPTVIVTSIASGPWNSAATWDVGIPGPTDDVIIAPGTTVTLDVTTAVTSVTVQGTGVLEYQSTPAVTLTVNGNVTVDAGGALRTSAAGVVNTHGLTVAGNLTNNGTLDLSTNAAAAAAGITFSSAGGVVFGGTGGTTDIRTLTINKGAAFSNLVVVSPTNLTVNGLSAAVGAFVTVTNGTVQFGGTYSLSGTVFSPAGYVIPATGGVWFNNPNLTVTGQNGSPSMSGYFQMSQGTYNIGTSSGNSLGFGNNMTVVVDGGAINAAGRFGVAAAGNNLNYTQTGGVITVCTVGNASATLASFDLGTGVGADPVISGGSIIIRLANTSGTIRDYRNEQGNTGNGITAGTVQFGDAGSGAAKAYQANGIFPNVVVDNTSANHSVTMRAPSFFFNNVRNLTINSGTTLNLGVGANNLLFISGTNVTNNGTLVSNSAGNRFVWFTATSVGTYQGTGVSTGTMTSFELQNTSVTMSQTNQLVVRRIIIFTGSIFGGNKFTLGDATAVVNPIQIGNTTTPTAAGTFDASPTFNLGAGVQQVSYLRTAASRSTGPEINPTRSVAFVTYDDNDPTHTLTVSGGDLTVPSTLALTNGHVITGANTVIATGTVTRTTGLVDGFLRKPVTAGGPVVRSFEVGSANAYSPVAVTFASVGTAGTLTAKATQGDHVSIGTSILNPARSVNRNWTLTNGGTGFTTADAVYNFVAGDLDGGTNTANLSVGKLDSGVWSYPTVGTRTATSTQATGMTSFSDFQLAELNTHTITASAGPGGTITPSGAVIVIDGASQAFTITPNPCFAIVDVLVDGNSVGPVASYTFTNVTTDHTIAASFSALPVQNLNTSICYATIQAALDDAATLDGHTIHAGPGVYEEQVHVTKDVTIDGDGCGVTTIRSPVTLTASFNNGNTHKPIVFVDGATVTITDLGVDGAGRGNLNNRFDGIAYWNSGGEVARVCVTDVRNTPLDGVQHGVGVYSDNNVAGPYALELDNVTITGFQKNGMALNGAGMTVDVHDCRVVGAGPTAITAQNGIQVSFGAGGSVARCAISDMSYTPATFVASGVLTFQGTPVTVTDLQGPNAITNVQAPVSWYDTNGQMNGIGVAGTGSDFGPIFIYNSSTSPVRAPQATRLNRPVASPLGRDLAGEGAKAAPNASYTVSVINSCLFGTDVAGTVGIFSYTEGGPLSVSAQNNEVHDWDIGLATFGIATLNANFNSIASNATAGYDNSASGAAQNAENNWWNAASGPSGAGPGTGDAIVGANVDFDPWLHSGSDVTAGCGFAPVSYTITASAGPNGSISPSGPVLVYEGGDQTFAISADPCYIVADVIVDGVSVGAVTSYTFLNVTANHTIAASFTGGSFTITASAGTGGSISPSGPVVVACGGDQTFSISADPCYTIDDVLVDGVSQGAVSSYTFLNVQTNHLISASFALTNYTIVASAGPGGSITPSGNVSVACGADQTFAISASTCNVIADVIVDGVSQGAVATYTFTNVQANHTIAASFSPITYTIVATAGPGGTITPSGAVVVNCGANQTFSIAANPCNFIADVIVDGSSVGAVASYTFLNVQANHTINAVFSVNPSSTSLTSDINPAKFGTKVNLTATVSPNTATGVVTFLDGITPIGAAPVAAGTATLSITTQLAPGVHSLSAAYSGDACNAPSVSPAYSQTIIPDNPPVPTVIFPNGGENLLVGGDVKLVWSATDDNAVVSVTLLISRDNGATYTPIAVDIPNTGTFTWTVTPPGTNGGNGSPVYSALFKVIAKDNANQTGEDVSNAPFSIFDLATPTTVLRLDAVPATEGVKVRWLLANADLFVSFAVERSMDEVGPWSAVETERAQDGASTVATDKSAAAGKAYWYRLVGTTNAGAQATFGPIKAEAGSPLSFALGSAFPNPTRHGFVIDFAVAKSAQVKLSLMDVQGRVVTELANGTYEPGRYRATWDGVSGRSAMNAGVYFIRYNVAGQTFTKRVTIQ